MIILGIDPGDEKSAFVLFDPTSKTIIPAGEDTNANIVKDITSKLNLADVMVIEKIANMGMPAVGASIFETAFWSGKFAQAWEARTGKEAQRIPRHQIKMHLCGSMRAKDANIRQSLLDKLGPQGTKKAPGPTYGISKHLWAALAVAVTYAETFQTPP